MKLKIMLSILLLLLQVGCGSKSYMNRVAARSNQHSFDQDSNYCWAVAYAYAPPAQPYYSQGNLSQIQEANNYFAAASAGFDAIARQEFIWGQCMDERGWYEVKTPKN